MPPFFRTLLMTFVICLIALFICSFYCSAALSCFHGVQIIMSANISLMINKKQFFHYDENIVTGVNYWFSVHSCWLFHTSLIAIFIILCCFSRNTKFFLVIFRTFSVIQVTKSYFYQILRVLFKQKKTCLNLS